MIARRCAIPYALAHPARTRLNTEPILPTLPERIEQSGPPISFGARVPWTDSRLEQESRRILFSRHPFEFHVEGGSEARRLSMQRHQVRCRHPILSPHLADHELRIAADSIRLSRTSLPLEFLEVAKQEDEALIFRNVVAPHRAGGTRKVRHFADDPGLTHDERGSHRSLGPELISRACSVEETRDPGGGGRRHQPRGRRAIQDLRLVGDRSVRTQSKRGEASPGKDRLRKGVRASAAAPTTGAAAPAVATAPRFGLLGGAFLRCVGGSGWLHDYLLPLRSRQVLIASLPWSPRWRE